MKIRPLHDRVVIKRMEEVSRVSGVEVRGGSPEAGHRTGGESEDERHAAGYRLIAPIGVRARAAG